jgi:hypothetical protein
MVYDVAVVDAGLTAVPPIALPYFDPREGAYRVARTEPLPLIVRGGDATPAGAPEDHRPAAADGALWPYALGGVAALLLALALIVAYARRKRRPPEPDARARFAERAAAGDVAAAFTEYLAARLRCAPAKVIDADLADRLQETGVSAPLAARAATLVQALVAARYGGHLGPESAREAQEIVDSLA